MKAGKVMFAPIRTGPNLEVGKPAIGVIREDGTFVLGTYGNDDGAIVGDHWVTIFGPDLSSALSPAVSHPTQSAVGIPRFDRLSVTEKQTVKPGTDNLITIALTSHDVAKYSVRAD